MPRDKTERIVILVDDALLVRIDDYRFWSRCTSRSDAIRGLLNSALNSPKTMGAAEAATSPRPDHSISYTEKTSEHAD